MPVIFAKERSTYISDQETDTTIRQEVGNWPSYANADSINGSLKVLNADQGPGSVTYRFTARQFQLIGVSNDGGYYIVADVVINGLSVSPYPNLATGTSGGANKAIAWFTSPDYGQAIALQVTIQNCPGSRGVFDNGVKLIY